MMVSWTFFFFYMVTLSIWMGLALQSVIRRWKYLFQVKYYFIHILFYLISIVKNYFCVLSGKCKIILFMILSCYWFCRLALYVSCLNRLSYKKSNFNNLISDCLVSYPMAFYYIFLVNLSCMCLALDNDKIWVQRWNKYFC